MVPSEALEHHARIARWLNSDRSGPVGTGQTFTSYLIRESVLEGRTTFLRGEISEALRVASPGYPDLPLTEADLPFSNGFAWLEQPLDLHPGRTPIRPPIQAVSWLIKRDQTFHGLFFVVWLAQVLVEGGLYGEANEWPFGSGWSQTRQAASTQGMIESSIRNTQGEARFLGSLFAFMKQQILVANVTSVERHVRRRLERDGILHEPLVRVIELRRREYAVEPEHGEPTDHEWSHRWIVRGHWRQQFYPSKHANQPIWITPYVKGPEDKPLKPPRATVFAVVR